MKLPVLKSFLATIFFILFTVLPLTSQIKLSGIIVDATNKESLEFANLVLLKPDSTFIDGTSCDSTGFFFFNNLSQGDYILSSTYTGYNRLFISISNLESDRDLGIIELQSSEIKLSEITVTGSSIIQKSDRKLIIPSASQIKASNNGFTLLRNLQLSRIVVNPFSNTVTTSADETVQLRINGVEVTTVEVVALQPENIIRIEYYEDTGMRYGNVTSVIDYIIRRRDSGGSMSSNLSNALWKIGFAEDYFSAKVNHLKSEFGLNTYISYRDLKWTHENHETFVFPKEIIQRDEIGKPTNVNEKKIYLAFNYNLNEPDKYLFNTTFTINYENFPNKFEDRNSTLYSSNDSEFISISDRSTWWKNSPALDLYFQRNLKKNQLIILNVVSTCMDSKSTRLYHQEHVNKDSFFFHSNITGKKYSLIAEGIYERNLKNGKLTGGVSHTQSFMENNYTGNVNKLVGLSISQSYGYIEYQLRKKNITNTFELGAMRTYNSQDNKSLEKYFFLPALQLVFNINNNANIRYKGYMSASPPALSDLNNVAQKIDDLQIRYGNPNLRTTWFISNTINASYNKEIFGTEFYANYTYFHNPIMEQTLFLDSIFIRTNYNQRAFHRIYSEVTFKLKPFRDYITLSLTPGFNRYVSNGADYFHFYNNWRIRASLMANYKKWVLFIEGKTRWNNFWGETLNLGEQMIHINAGYNEKKWGASIMIMNPFTGKYSRGYYNFSAVAPYNSDVYTNNLGQIIIFNFSINLNFGRKYNIANKRLDNSDNDSGIMTGTKN